MSVSKKPMVLVILDGYGYREEQQDNAIFSAKTPGNGCTVGQSSAYP